MTSVPGLPGSPSSTSINVRVIRNRRYAWVRHLESTTSFPQNSWKRKGSLAAMVRSGLEQNDYLRFIIIDSCRSPPRKKVFSYFQSMLAYHSEISLFIFTIGLRQDSNFGQRAV